MCGAVEMLWWSAACKQLINNYELLYRHSSGLRLRRGCWRMRREFNLTNMYWTLSLWAVPVHDTACLLPQVICTCPQEFNCTVSLRKELLSQQHEGGSVWLWIIKMPHSGLHRKSVGMQYKEFKKAESHLDLLQTLWLQGLRNSWWLMAGVPTCYWAVWSCFFLQR